MPHELVPGKQRANAKSMRKAMTEAELKLWNELRGHRLMGLSFRRQMPIGPYIVDFACSAKRLIIELDGAHHAEAEQARHDKVRDEFLRQQGWTILRFWNDDVLRGMDDVCAHVVALAAGHGATAGGAA